MREDEVEKILGGNWLKFFNKNFSKKDPSY